MLNVLNRANSKIFKIIRTRIDFISMVYGIIAFLLIFLILHYILSRNSMTIEPLSALFGLLSSLDIMSILAVFLTLIGVVGVSLHRWVRNSVKEDVLDTIRTAEAKSLISTAIYHYKLIETGDGVPEISTEARISLLKEAVVFSGLALRQANQIKLEDNLSDKILLIGLSASNCGYFFYELSRIALESRIQVVKKDPVAAKELFDLSEYYKKKAIDVLSKHNKEVELASEETPLFRSNSSTVKCKWWDIKESALFVRYTCGPGWDKENIARHYESLVLESSLDPKWRQTCKNDWERVRAGNP